MELVRAEVPLGARHQSQSMVSFFCFCFWFLHVSNPLIRFCSALALVAGSVRMRDARHRHTQPQRTETRLITMRLHHRYQDRKRRAGRQRISLNVCAADGSFPFVMRGNTQRPALSLLAPTQAASNAAANDDGDALLNRKRVGFLFFCFFSLTDDWLNLQWRS